jgi:hypothetical protein
VLQREQKMTARMPQQLLQKPIKQPVRIYDFMQTVQHNTLLNPHFIRALDIHQKDRYGNTALYWAIYHHNLQNVEILLHYGCALEVTAEGRHAAFFAIDTNNLKILACLMEHGMNLHTQYEKENVYEYVKRLGSKEMIASVRAKMLGIS